MHFRAWIGLDEFGCYPGPIGGAPTEIANQIMTMLHLVAFTGIESSGFVVASSSSSFFAVLLIASWLFACCVLEVVIYSFPLFNGFKFYPTQIPPWQQILPRWNRRAFAGEHGVKHVHQTTMLRCLSSWKKGTSRLRRWTRVHLLKNDSEWRSLVLNMTSLHIISH